jgi:catechol 2,3-dioxygenase-like lactoylglutathione lyase family enzyme
MISHVSIGVSDVQKAGDFYDKILAPLGTQRIMVFDEAIAYGAEFPEFWIQAPINEQPASAGNGVHICLDAPSQAAVDQFHALGVDAGAIDDGKPGLRPEYMAEYYAAFLKDPDGNKIEALFLPTPPAA